MFMCETWEQCVCEEKRWMCVKRRTGTCEPKYVHKSVTLNTNTDIGEMKNEIYFSDYHVSWTLSVLSVRWEAFCSALFFEFVS